MLSRRSLLKAIGSALFAVAGGRLAWQLWRNRNGSGQVAGVDERVVLEGPAPILSFFLLSDIHMSATNSGLEAKLHTALKDVTRFSPPADTIVLGGDQVDGGREDDYQVLTSILSGYKLPKLYGLMGNHEYYHIWYNENGDWSTETGPNGKTDAQARERFLRLTGHDRPYQDAWVNGVHLIMLSQEAYVQERPEVGEGAWYSDEQMAWLEQVLRPHADGRPAFVFIHQPLPPAGSDGGQHRLIRAKEFRAILEPYRNVLVFSGHTHRNLETEGRYVRDTTFHWFSNASVGKTRGSAVPNPVQGLHIQVFGDRVVVRGREFSNRTWIPSAEWTIELA
jgi:3',5'-cyclic-AMP phosphodiesterase